MYALWAPGIGYRMAVPSGSPEPRWTNSVDARVPEPLQVKSARMFKTVSDVLTALDREGIGEHMQGLLIRKVEEIATTTYALTDVGAVS